MSRNQAPMRTGRDARSDRPTKPMRVGRDNGRRPEECRVRTARAFCCSTAPKKLRRPRWQRAHGPFAFAPRDHPPRWPMTALPSSSSGAPTIGPSGLTDQVTRNTFRVGRTNSAVTFHELRNGEPNNGRNKPVSEDCVVIGGLEGPARAGTTKPCAKDRGHRDRTGDFAYLWSVRFWQRARFRTMSDSESMTPCPTDDVSAADASTRSRAAGGRCGQVRISMAAPRMLPRCDRGRAPAESPGTDGSRWGTPDARSTTCRSEIQVAIAERAVGGATKFTNPARGRRRLGSGSTEAYDAEGYDRLSRAQRLIGPSSHGDASEVAPPIGSRTRVHG